MPLMTAPTRHPKTGVYRIRIAIPPHLRDITQRDHGKRAEFIATLGTKEPKEAKARAPEVIAKFSKWLQAAEAEHRGALHHLTDQEVSAICGRWLAAQEAENRHHLKGSLQEHEDTADHLGEILRALEDHPEASASARDAVIATAGDTAPLLASMGFTIDQDSRERLAARLVRVQWEWSKDAAERARTGRWRPSLSSGDFASFNGREAVAGAGCTTDSLLDGWGLDRGLRRDAQPRQRAFYDRLRTMERLVAFVGHNDAQRITKADAVRLKEDMQARSLTAATIRNDLSELSAIWRWGLTHGKVTGDNPFAGISPPKARKRSREVRPFTAEEARRVLEAARGQNGVLRWLPWVCAMTGARLSEVVQSAKEDVAVVSGVTVLRIHDDGEDDSRSIKNDASRRSVPIHPALVGEGFLDYVAALPAGSPLFPDVKPDAIFGKRSISAGKKVGRWLRDLGITDERISPNHSWRHFFVDACRAVAMPQEIRSALTGHSGRVDESAGYGDGMKALVQVMAEHLARIVAPV